MARQVVRLSLEGAGELEAALEALGKQVATRIGRRAVREPARALAAVLRLTAPYLPGARARRSGDYGHLRDNLTVVSVRAKKPGLILYRVSTGDAYWGNFLELGTAQMAPQPWMRPQVDGMQAEIVTMQIGELRQGIEREAKRAAKRAVMANGRNG